MTGLRSGQVARAAGVNPETLRYYERRGLLGDPGRTLGGHRIYREDAVRTLRVIKVAQRVGFTLEEIVDLLEAGAHRHGRAKSGLAQQAQAKLVEVEGKIAALQVMRERLRAAIQAGCDDLITCAESPHCPLPFAELAEHA